MFEPRRLRPAGELAWIAHPRILTQASSPVKPWTTSFDSAAPKARLSRFADRPEVIAIPGGRNAFTRRVKARFISTGADALLAQLAHTPVLAIGHVPKLDCV